MLKLDELLKLTREMYPDSESDLAHLLCAWGICDPANELPDLLSESGIDKQGFLMVATRFLDIPDTADRKLIRDCILQYQPNTKAMHILATLCNQSGHRITKALCAAGLNLPNLQKNINLLLQRMEPASEAGLSYSSAEQQVILNYGRDLTALARTGAFADLCDRPQELERLYQVLLRKNKANAAFTGPAGVGKTALVELLAVKIAKNDVPAMLRNARLFEISMGRLVAGTRFRGDFEERIEQVLSDLKKCQPAILFIDEMHLIWGAGRAEGITTDAANLLKPYLARGEIKVIGATTVSEYHRYIVQDAALNRRFQEIRLAVPEKEMVLAMVRRQAGGLSKHHQVLIGETEMLRAVELTDRCIPNRLQPDKGIDLLDSAAGMAHRKGQTALDDNDLIQSLAVMVDLPPHLLPSGDARPLKDLTLRLKERIIGQDHALEKITATITQRWRGLGNPERNIGSFLLAGDTGVGKTETARALAEILYGAPQALLHLDLGEYSQYGSVNKLIGAPAGYIGSDRDGILTGWITAQGRGVILFDEIEKAHRDVYDLILGLLDNGRITNAAGEQLDTRRCVVVLTTNALTPKELRSRGIGFGAQGKPPDAQDLLERHFPREFLGRFDNIILFKSPDQADMRRIIRLRLDEAARNLRDQDIELSYNEPALLDYLGTQVQTLRNGARGIARLIDLRILQPVALALLQDTSPGLKRFILDKRFYSGGHPCLVSKTMLACH